MREPYRSPGRQRDALVLRHVPRLRRAGGPVHAVRVVPDEVPARTAGREMVPQEGLREPDRTRRHVVRVVRERPPDDGCAEGAGGRDELPPDDVAGEVRVPAGDESGQGRRARGRRVEDPAGVGHPREAEVGPPRGEEVARLASRRVAVVEETVGFDAVGLRDPPEGLQQGRARPRRRLPVAVVPERRRDEKDPERVRPVRPAELARNLAAPVAVSTAEQHEHGMAGAPGGVVGGGDAVPHPHDGVVRGAGADLDAPDFAGGGRRGGMRKRERREREEDRQPPGHETGMPFSSTR